MSGLYFAYGSNLDETDWAAFCARFGWDASALVALERAALPDHALAFTHLSRSRGGGTLDVIPRPGCVVDGTLFRVRGDGWAALDAKEGHPDHYERRDVFVLDASGRTVAAQTYVVVDARRRPFVEPTPAYLEVCERGRVERGLDVHALRLAARNAPPEPVSSFFFYGTLMRGERLAPHWTGEDVGCALLAQAKGRLVDHGAYPGLVLDDDRTVQGEFVRFRRVERALATLDRLEGFIAFGEPGNLYDRSLADVHVGDGRIRRAWLYVTRNADAPTIESGDWRRRNGRLRAAVAAVLLRHAEGAPDFEEWASAAATHHRDERPAPRLSLGELTTLVARGRLSERRIAQKSERWAVRFGPEAIEEARSALGPAPEDDPDADGPEID